MFTKTSVCGASIGVVMGAMSLLMVAAPGTARAGAEDREIAIANLMGPLGDAIRWEKPDPSYSGDEIKGRRDSCRGAIAEAKKEGVRAGDAIPGWDAFKIHPKAKQVGTSYVIKFADVGWFCDELDKRLDYWDMVKQLGSGIDVQGKLKVGLSDDEKRTVEAHQVDYWSEARGRCTASVATQVKRGLSPDTVIEVKGGKVKLADAAPVCAALGEYAELLRAAYQIRFAELARKYEAVGIKGKRLELFVYYDGVDFYNQGCKSSTGDPAKLKAAKALFQWLTDSDGLITIRKYAFKGDTYKVTEKKFVTEAKAYKGCK